MTERNSASIEADDVVIEWAPFRLAPGVAPATLLQASEFLQRDFLVHQKGFLRRELLRGHEGQWVDLVYWADQASADAAMTAAGASDSCRSYFQLMTGVDSADPAAGLLHMRRVRAY